MDKKFNELLLWWPNTTAPTTAAPFTLNGTAVVSAVVFGSTYKWSEGIKSSTQLKTVSAIVEGSVVSAKHNGPDNCSAVYTISGTAVVGAVVIGVTLFWTIFWSWVESVADVSEDNCADNSLPFKPNRVAVVGAVVIDQMMYDLW